MRKPLLETCARLHVRDVKASIPQWATSAQIEVQGPAGSQTLTVMGRPTNLGNGYRYFFLCGQCGKLYESLYQRDFSGYLCRECQGLVYASSMKLPPRGEEA